MTLKYLQDQIFSNTFELGREKTNILVSDQVLHKPDCTAKEDC